MVILENNNFRLGINPLGAELKSCFDKSKNKEVLWDSNPEFWGKSSPVLFPIVGGLKDNNYIFESKKYTLGRHGFARERIFELEYQDVNKVIFLIESDEETLQVYPFHFELRLIYEFIESGFSLSYEVKNTGLKTMYFSIGAHPAFKIPFKSEENFDDYYLEFEKEEDFDAWPLSADGLIETSSHLIIEKSNILKLSKELFYNDALVFKGFKSDWVKIKSSRHTEELKFNMIQFPYLGIWSAKNADFVCIEPWCGIADVVEAGLFAPECEN